MPVASILEIKKKLPNVDKTGKSIVLQSSNLVILRGPVTSKSVSDVQRQILSMSHRLSKSTPIYLVLNTPGGSVGAGLTLIDYLKSIPQKVHTITLFAASMGFQIAQNMGTRYITPNGTLMSHRARLGGLGGQLDGELESRYKMIKRSVDYLDVIAAKRMKISLSKYKNMIINEYWVHGFDSKLEKAADQVANVSCGQSLKGTKLQVFETMFGNATVEFSKCPLIQAPISVSFGNRVAENNKTKVMELVQDSFTNNRNYINNYINTGKHNEMYGL